MGASPFLARLRGDPGLLATLAALLAVVAVYGPTIGYGVLGYDDTWLVRDNAILMDPSPSALHAVFFRFDPSTRFTLGAEYLPVRDLSIMADRLVWGDWWGGYHLTNLLVYAATVVVWFRALLAWGIERKLAGVAMLLWSMLASHAESVSWLSERKGLLAALFAGVSALALARFRAGGGRGIPTLVIAAISAAAAVWSKAPAAFTLAALAGLEVVLPARRMSWRRSVIGLGVVGLVTAAAFVPVLLVATDASVVATESKDPAGPLEMAIGLHGFYLRLAALGMQNAVSYPIVTDGPSILDITLGAVTLVVAIVVAAVPSRGRWQPSPVLRAACILWLFGWFPISRLVLPLKSVLVSDRYLLLPSLGIALALALGIAALPRIALRRAVLGIVLVVAILRSLDARSSWRDDEALWERAATSNPRDGGVWSMYIGALLERVEPQAVMPLLEEALRHSRSPRLLMRRALMTLQMGKRAEAVTQMREAALAGEARAMSNLALLLLEDGQLDEAIRWARTGAQLFPQASSHRALGRVALARRNIAEAHAAFLRAYLLEPTSLPNRFNLGLVLMQLGRQDEARPHLEACLAHPQLGPQARAILAAPPAQR